MTGSPFVMRFATGLRTPKNAVPGTDVAGTVEAVGANVHRLRPGDEVFGWCAGAFAEYAAAPEAQFVTRPANLTFEQAAAVPIAAITALQGLRDKGKVQPGQRVLINGASGGVGTFAVQIAKTFGAHVTGVCSTRNLELVRSIGAHEVIDYTQQDYTDGTERYDVVLDMVGNHSLSANRRVLEPDGRYVLIGGGGPDDGKWIGPLIGPIKGLVTDPFVSQEILMLLAQLNKQDLAVLAELMQDGKVTPVVDRSYPLSEIVEAMRYLETGRARGKVIVTID
jgi:NADPH:quinone reductase-like Zn-dependent oxidoreductase